MRSIVVVEKLSSHLRTTREPATIPATIQRRVQVPITIDTSQLPASVGRPFRAETEGDVKSKYSLREGDFRDRLAILQTIGRMRGSLEALQGVPLSGRMFFTIRPPKVIETGRVIPRTREALEDLRFVLKTLRGIAHSLGHEFPENFTDITVGLVQRCELTWKQ